MTDEDRAVEICRKAKHDRRRFFFIGNGGSAAIASHMAADWLKNGRVAAMCFNDPALMSCISNDIGYEQVFSLPLSYHGEPGDVLFAISSSGESKSITKAANTARFLRMRIITLSGFRHDNQLKGMGDVNFYVPSSKYGEVEIAHHTICHGILDRCISS